MILVIQIACSLSISNYNGFYARLKLTNALSTKALR